MLVESHDDLVTFSPVETLREDRHPLCRIAGERQFIARDTHELRCLVPHQLAIVEPIAIRGIFRYFPGDAGLNVEHDSRRRPRRPGIHKR